jgi:hypothetical protein
MKSLSTSKSKSNIIEESLMTDKTYPRQLDRIQTIEYWLLVADVVTNIMWSFFLPNKYHQDELLIATHCS